MQLSYLQTAAWIELLKSTSNPEPMAMLFEEQLTLTDTTTTGRDGEREWTSHSVAKLGFLGLLSLPTGHLFKCLATWLKGGRALLL